MKVPFQGRTTYYDTFRFVEPCFGLWFDGCLDFFAMIFPVVYIGAIAVSFLFVVMMFHIQIAEIHEEVLRYLPGMPTRSHESFSRYPVRPPDRSSLRGSTQAIALPPLLMLWLTPQADSSNPTLSKEKKSWDYDLLSAGLLVVIGWTLSSSKVLACKDKMTLIFTSMEPDVSLSPTDLTQKESMGVDTSIAADAEEEILALRAKMLTLPWKEALLSLPSPSSGYGRRNREEGISNNWFYYGAAHDVHIDLLCASASSIG
ncbi:hypothetical protein KY290_015598 [Solanum tuberosum]|uniref:Uncharacterized protein n=1 Tax=Solanum tuberosum TaxID=4113 RepID=A0ABQ7VVN4_SOLTU|nr:hypothetical protein KY290_015598 [Solanum tuberosum]